MCYFQIDEPNTPYHYDSGAESDGSHQKSPSQKRPTIDFDLLQDKLTDVANCPSSPSSHGDSSVDEEKKRQFREHRKIHYNEMDKVRQFRNDHPDDPFDVDDNNNDSDDEWIRKLRIPYYWIYENRVTCTLNHIIVASIGGCAVGEGARLPLARLILYIGLVNYRTLLCIDTTASLVENIT